MLKTCPTQHLLSIQQEKLQTLLFFYIQPTGWLFGISEPSTVSSQMDIPSTSKAQILAAVEADARIRCSELRGCQSGFCGVNNGG